jgi:cytochrome c oxidase subunit 4
MANHNHDHGHHETHAHKSHTKEYIAVFFILTILTIVELMIPGLNTPYHYKAAGLIGLAFGKACIVAYFYMHLKEETRWLKLIAAVPLTAVIYAVGLILESAYR